jgi:hypothetical protein
LLNMPYVLAHYDAIYPEISVEASTAGRFMQDR